MWLEKLIRVQRLTHVNIEPAFVNGDDKNVNVIPFYDYVFIILTMAIKLSSP